MHSFVLFCWCCLFSFFLNHQEFKLFLNESLKSLKGASPIIHSAKSACWKFTFLTAPVRLDKLMTENKSAPILREIYARCSRISSAIECENLSKLLHRHFHPTDCTARLQRRLLTGFTMSLPIFPLSSSPIWAELDLAWNLYSFLDVTDNSAGSQWIGQNISRN